MPRTNTFQACPYFSGSSRGWNGVKPHTCLMPYSRHINLFSQDEWSLDRRHSACLCKGGIEACFYIISLSLPPFTYTCHTGEWVPSATEKIFGRPFCGISPAAWLITMLDWVVVSICSREGRWLFLKGKKKKRGVLRVWATVQTLERSGAVQLFLFLHVPPLKPDSGGFTLGGTKPSCTRQNNMPQHTDT